MIPDDLPAKENESADEYTGNYGRGGYYGYTYDQESYNRQVKRASKIRKAGHVQAQGPEEKRTGDGESRVPDSEE
jgi:hypothetical protein